MIERMELTTGENRWFNQAATRSAGYHAAADRGGGRPAYLQIRDVHSHVPALCGCVEAAS